MFARRLSGRRWQTRLVIPISDPTDPRLDGYRGLRGKESREVLWAEGITVVERLLDSGLPITSLLVSTKAVDRLMYLVERTDAPVLVVPPDVITEVLGFVLQRGIVAMAPRPPLAELDDVIRDATRLVVLEGLNDAENLGAIARSARGLGADGLVLDATCADPYYRRSVRVSMGEMLHLPIARVELTEALERLAAAGWAIWALTPRRDAAAITSRPGPARVALVVGAEGPGLSDRVLAAYTNVRIPMRSDVDSLNVGHALAAALAIVQSSTA
ncbi:MAG: hypothetical protein RLZZ362_2261 [Actinomycetota bacterium]